MLPEVQSDDPIGETSVRRGGGTRRRRRKMADRRGGGVREGARRLRVLWASAMRGKLGLVSLECALNCSLFWASRLRSSRIHFAPRRRPSRVLAAEPDAHTCQIYGRKGACLRSGAAVSETGAAVILSHRGSLSCRFFKRLPVIRGCMQSWFEWLECGCDLLDWKQGRLG